MSIAGIVGVLLGVAAVVGAVIYYVRRGITTQVDLEASQANDAALRAHIAQVTAADNAAARARIKEFDAKATSANGAAAAAGLLRDAVSQDDDPSTNRSLYSREGWPGPGYPPDGLRRRN